MNYTDLAEKIIESAVHTSIVMADFTGKIIAFNRGASNLFGYTREEAIGQSLPELTFTKDDLDTSLFEHIVERAKQEDWVEERHARRHKKGGEFSVISTITCVKDENGKPFGILEIAQDMPNLFRLERELKGSKKFLENILESSIDSIVTTDKKGYITYANRSFKELIGLPGQQLIGQHICNYYKDGIDQARLIMEKLKEFGRIRDYEFDMKVGERIIPIRTSDSLLHDDYGEIVGTMGVFQDITARKKLSDRLSATHAELVQAVKMRALGDLVTGVAHEINNPLMASETFLHLLEKEKLPSHGSRNKILLVKECNNRIQNIVNRLKEFSRQPKFEFSAMFVNDAVSSVLTLTRQQLLNEGIELKLKLSDNLPPVLGDKNQIEQVLLNLISNARDAMEDNRQKLLTVETKLENEDRKVEIYVSDTGKGMATEQIEQIFNPFFTTKDSDKGIGLGLSITYRIIEDHQGSIKVNSRLKKGTTFTVSLPVYIAGAKEKDVSQ